MLAAALLVVCVLALARSEAAFPAESVHGALTLVSVAAALGDAGSAAVTLDSVAAAAAAPDSAAATAVSRPPPPPRASAAPSTAPRGRAHYAQRAATGAAGLPATFSALARDVHSAAVFSTHVCTGAWDGITRQGNRTCAFRNLYYDGSTSVPWERAAWVYVADVAGAPPGAAGTPAVWAAALKAELANVRLPASNREEPQWFLEVLVYERVATEDEGVRCGARAAVRALGHVYSPPPRAIPPPHSPRRRPSIPRSFRTPRRPRTSRF